MCQGYFIGLSSVLFGIQEIGTLKQGFKGTLMQI